MNNPTDAEFNEFCAKIAGHVRNRPTNYHPAKNCNHRNPVFDILIKQPIGVKHMFKFGEDIVSVGLDKASYDFIVLCMKDVKQNEKNRAFS